MSKRDQVAKREFSDEDYSQHYQLKKAGMEKVLGPMHDMVGPCHRPLSGRRPS